LDIQVGWGGMHREEYTRVLCRYGHDEGAVQECDEECLHEMTPARPVVMVTPAMLLNSGRSYNSKCPPGASRPPGTSCSSMCGRRSSTSPRWAWSGTQARPPPPPFPAQHNGSWPASVPTMLCPTQRWLAKPRVLRGPCEGLLDGHGAATYRLEVVRLVEAAAGPPSPAGGRDSV